MKFSLGLGLLGGFVIGWFVGLVFGWPGSGRLTSAISAWAGAWTPADWVAYAKAVSWPVALLILVLAFVSLYALSAPFRALLAGFKLRLTRLEAAGISIELSEERAATFTAVTQDNLRTFREATEYEIERNLSSRDVRTDLQTFFKHFAGKLGDPNGLRCTIHVPDPLFDGYLYQALDYYPGKTGKGRSFSIRFGIIGLSWRLSQSRVTHNVSEDATTLMIEWGMTEEESTHAGDQRQSFATVVLRHDGRAVGLLYVDANAKEAFKTFECHDDDGKEGCIKDVEEWPEVKQLAASVYELMKSVRLRSPTLTLEGSGFRR